MTTSTAIFLATGSVTLFAFLTVSHWVIARSAERRTQGRYALLRQVAERPTESARLVIDLLREEDVRLEAKARQKTLKARQDGILGGWILIAIGVGMAIMLASIADDQPRIWTIGLMPMLIGVVMIVHECVSGRGRDRETPAQN
jgi:hypothetical protein